jgi:CheY-like chemotaxis protein
MDLMSKDAVILYAEDDPEDVLLVSDAFKIVAPELRLQIVGNGEELLDYLKGSGKYSARDSYPLPSIILLDINMPKMDGSSALAKIRADQDFLTIPICIFTTSAREQDKKEYYQLGVNSIIIKPVSFQRLKEIVMILYQYWFETSLSGWKE